MGDCMQSPCEGRGEEKAMWKWGFRVGFAELQMSGYLRVGRSEMHGK